MKFSNKVLFSILSIILVNGLFCIHNEKNVPEVKLEYDQTQAYPNQFHPATNSTNLAHANYTAPRMSMSLSESASHVSYRLIDFLDVFKFVMYRMTRGEAEQIFLFADGNRNGQLSNQEWMDFSALYILPFEACDSNGDYLLDEAEFKFCFEKDPKFKTIIFPRRYGNNPELEIMEVMSTRQANLINFNEYLFTRRAAYAWTHCHSNSKYIAKTSFSCALKTALSFERKFTFKLTDLEIYDAGVRIDNDFEIQLNYISYLRILHYFNLFNIYSAGNSIAQLEKNQLIKAIREDRLPNNLEEDTIKVWYDLISSNPFKKADSMGFKTFAFFWSLHRLFNKYSIERPGQITENEMIKLLKDKTVPAFTLHGIDLSFIKFSAAEYQNASLSLNTLRPNESAYFSQFLSIKENVNTVEKVEEKKGSLRSNKKEAVVTNEESQKFESLFTSGSGLREVLAESLQIGMTKAMLNLQNRESVKEEEGQDASANTAALWHSKSVNATYYKTHENEENRRIFFTIFRDPILSTITKENYYKAFALANLFNYFVNDGTFVVLIDTFVDRLMKTYSLSTPPINVKQRENYTMYKRLPRGLHLDLLTFLQIENFRNRLGSSTVDETRLKLVLQDYGMRDMPDTVLDLGLVSYGVSRSRIFDVEKTLEKCLHVQCVASDYKRVAFLQDKFNLKTNLDPSRRFPAFPPRSMASPFV